LCVKSLALPLHKLVELTLSQQLVLPLIKQISDHPRQLSVRSLKVSLWVPLLSPWQQCSNEPVFLEETCRSEFAVGEQAARMLSLPVKS
jgi:hypothetical protein